MQGISYGNVGHTVKFLGVYQTLTAHNGHQSPSALGRQPKAGVAKIKLMGEQVERAGRTFRTYRLLLITLLLRPFGNLSLAWGMKHFPQLLSFHPFLYLKALSNPYVAIGISLL